MRRILWMLLLIGGWSSEALSQLGQPKSVIAYDFGPVVDQTKTDSCVYDIHATVGWIHLVAYDEHGCCEFSSRPFPVRGISDEEIASMLAYGNSASGWDETGPGMWKRADGAIAKLQDGSTFVLFSKESVDRLLRSILNAEIVLKNNGRIDVKNIGEEPWQDVVITVNPDDQDNGYKFRIKELKPQNNVSVKDSAFCKADGTRFDFEKTMVMNVKVVAFDPDGNKQSMIKKFGYGF